jgi:predicted RNase H-like HicB family nuclease
VYSRDHAQESPDFSPGRMSMSSGLPHVAKLCYNNDMFQRTIIVDLEPLDETKSKWSAISENLGGVYAVGTTSEEALENFKIIAADLFDQDTVCLFRPRYSD